MNYLIIQPGHEPCLTNWFDIENNYVEGMTVYALVMCEYTTDGKTWKPITEDHL